MKKRSKLFLLLSSSLLGTGMVAASAVAITSCSSVNQIPKVEESTYDAIVNKNTKANALDSATLELDPNLNQNAIATGMETLSKLSVQDWQNEFNRSLTKFYKAYELEEDINNNVELESEVKRISVVSKKDMKDGVELQLKVTYEVEEEVNDKETEKLVTLEKSIKVQPMFATLTELQSITKQLKDLDKNSGNSNIDFDDLLELYVGDNDDHDDRSIFEQVKNLASNIKSGGLLGMRINVSDLKYEPKPKATDVSKGEMFAPLLTTPRFLKPVINFNDNFLTLQEKQLINPIIDKTLISYDKISKITLNNFKSTFANNQFTLEQLNSVLEIDYTPDEFNHVKSIIVEESTSSINELAGGIIKINLSTIAKSQPTQPENPTTPETSSTFEGEINNNTNTPSNPTEPEVLEKIITLEFKYYNIWFAKK